MTERKNIKNRGNAPRSILKSICQVIVPTYDDSLYQSVRSRKEVGYLHSILKGDSFCNEEGAGIRRFR